MIKWNLCKCCYINKTKTAFCTSCVDSGSYGKGLDSITGEILKPNVSENVEVVFFATPQIRSSDYSEMVKETVDKLDRSILT